MSMKTLLLALAVLVLSTGSAGANENAPAMNIVRAWIADFNKGDGQSAIALCAERGAILDDISPFVWQGDAACSKWLTDYDVFVKQHEVTAEAFTPGKVRHLDIVRNDAYVVLPVTENYKLKGRPMVEAALVTVSLHKGPSGWRIAGWTWARR